MSIEGQTSEMHTHAFIFYNVKQNHANYCNTLPIYELHSGNSAILLHTYNIAVSVMLSNKNIPMNLYCMVPWLHYSQDTKLKG